MADDDPAAPTPRTLIRAITRNEKAPATPAATKTPATTPAVATATTASSTRKHDQAQPPTTGTETTSRTRGRRQQSATTEDPTPRTLIREITREQAGDQTITPDTSIAKSANASTLPPPTPRQGDLLRGVLDTTQSSMLAASSSRVPSANQSLLSIASGPGTRDASLLAADTTTRPHKYPHASAPSPSDASIWEVLHEKQHTVTTAATAAKPAVASTTEPQAEPVKRRAPRRSSDLLPSGVIRQILHSATSTRLSTAAVDTVGACLDRFMATFAARLRDHAREEGRHTLEVADVETLMLRQGLISSIHDLRSLLHEHLPMEFVEQLLPSTVTDNHLHPACKRPKLGQLQ